MVCTEFWVVSRSGSDTVVSPKPAILDIGLVIVVTYQTIGVEVG